ncbi:MAG: ferritin [Hyphomicrobiales bacterium]|nr:MAG: ferritin [Hyphomicrobiales bacterium]
MKLDANIEKALNDQINSELHASYMYLAMAAYFDAESLPGFAAWFRAQSQEENGHAMKIYDFVYKRDGRVVLEGLEKPQASFDSPEAAIAYAFEMEEKVTQQIHALFEQSQQAREFGTQAMLNWFLDEQIAEEDQFRRILDQVHAAGDSRWHLLILDGQLSARDRGGEAEQ